MTYADVTRKLRRLGCVEVKRRTPGSHRYWLNPKTGAVAPLPDWGASDLKLGTVRAVVRQLGLDWQSFIKA